MWNRFKTTADFTRGKPWLLRFFDQIQFYPVSESELLQLREEFVQGRFKLRIEESRFRLRDYHDFLSSIELEITAFKAKQQNAFDAERERWIAAGLDVVSSDERPTEIEAEPLHLPDGTFAARAPLPANVWQVLVKVGDEVQEGDKLVILEAMKMEIAITAPATGHVSSVLCAPSKLVAPGEALCLITVPSS
jgi:urea carboxylase